MDSDLSLREFLSFPFLAQRRSSKEISSKAVVKVACSKVEDKFILKSGTYVSSRW